MRGVNTDVAYEYIRRRILQGGYPPGHALRTEALALEVKVSRTPIRDALRKLEADGLVTIRPHLGATVKKMDLKEFREMSDLRLALESHAAGLAADHRTPADLSEIQLALEAMRRCTDRIEASVSEHPGLEELAREDVRFHIAIISAAKNDLIKREILRLHLVNRVMSAPVGRERTRGAKAESDVRRRTVLAKHQDIFDAIAASDAAAARREMGYHLQELIDHNLRVMARAEAVVLARELSPEELAYGGHAG